MARILIAILALLALAASPITALAAPMACGMNTPQAVASSMASMDASADRHAAPVKSDPCCDKMLKGCAKSCSTACAGGVAVLAVISTIAAFEVPMALDAPKSAAWRSHLPIGPDRPPKSLA
ncbi:MAG: hypothetical protein Q8Q88_12615 [Phenylobacterium sp.]|uniref:hypothetical protein n=1 Tax=Phenylobacterium sp. TaxID=1871053 RepID=UPI002736E319|nr:hypothetical protein [Phenylobacterium sp.]MDP3747878.1 hypothetical protein [Phenylobacterium sp.]